MNQHNPPPPVYFASLTVDNVKCFKGKQTIDLSDGNGKPALWTVILGNNNTGKTTLLRCLAHLNPTVTSKIYHAIFPKSSDSKATNRIDTQFDRIDAPLEYSVSIQLLTEEALEPWTIQVKRKTDDRRVANFGIIPDQVEERLVIYGYGTARRMAPYSFSETNNQDTIATLFSEEAILINAEEWLLQTYLAAKNDSKKAEWRLEKIKKLLTSGILPDVKDFELHTTEQLDNYVLFQTDYGKVRLTELGYGYQTCLAWLADLMKRQFDRYPDSENPLAEPAIVLVDELDLHLHPEWQRQIIQFLTRQFPRTQFIVTSHSPLVVQSADQVNLVLLEKVGDQVTIRQPQMTTYKGWTVEEILDELMGLDERTQSDTYLGFIKQFDEALDEDNYAQAKQAYDELDKILHPRSSQRKLLRLQMSSLIPEDTL
ncbi:MAG: hypothetical protein BWK78_01380 [Thiotrichaceae bacterium IS1]|nr:MAG: hypothetical protein BWK78_01380 [Thiotrichaceae bacterium IS1]